MRVTTVVGTVDHIAELKAARSAVEKAKETLRVEQKRRWARIQHALDEGHTYKEVSTAAGVSHAMCHKVLTMPASVLANAA